jgi:preprotein translocase subunit YajC
MSFWTQLSALLATTESAGWLLGGNGLALLAQGANGGEQAPQPSFLELLQPFLIPFVIIILMYQLIVARPQRREQAKRDELMKSLKKNDPVVTIGGIIGSVVSVSEDGSEVTVKVDDNSRIKFRRDAIRDVIRKPEPEKEGEAK